MPARKRVQFEEGDLVLVPDLLGHPLLVTGVQGKTSENGNVSGLALDEADNGKVMLVYCNRYDIQKRVAEAKDVMLLLTETYMQPDGDI